MSYSLWPHGLYSPWTSPGQSTGVGSHSLLQGIFPTQGLNPGLLNCGQILYLLSHELSHKGRPLDCKKIKPVSPKVNQSWIFIGRIDDEAEAPVLWPLDAKSQLIRKDPDGGQDWRQEEKGTTEDDMVGWHHWFDGHEFEQAPGVGDGQGSLACCSPWGRKESEQPSEWTITTDPIVSVITLNVNGLIGAVKRQEVVRWGERLNCTLSVVDTQ